MGSVITVPLLVLQTRCARKMEQFVIKFKQKCAKEILWCSLIQSYDLGRNNMAVFTSSSYSVASPRLQISDYHRPSFMNFQVYFASHVFFTKLFFSTFLWEFIILPFSIQTIELDEADFVISWLYSVDLSQILNNSTMPSSGIN